MLASISNISSVWLRAGYVKMVTSRGGPYRGGRQTDGSEPGTSLQELGI